MYKILLPIVLLLSGCSYFTFNAAMCEKIASEPGAVMPQECIDYNEKDAQKAFDKVTKSKEVSDKDLTFDKDE